MAPRTGRPPKQKTPRNQSINLRLTEEEIAKIQECADRLKESRTNVIVKGVTLLLEQIEGDD